MNSPQSAAAFAVKPAVMRIVSENRDEAQGCPLPQAPIPDRPGFKELQINHTSVSFQIYRQER
jgi:hypothetical protein